MEIKQANYIGSFPRESACPKPNKPEYAFIGRSNVGKSSLINMLCHRKDLARTSKKPGKTQMLNYFLINESWYLVDLPGYGYAKISKKTRAKWGIMMTDFLQKRETLQCAFILIDANVPPQAIDTEFVNQLGTWQVPFVIAYTKTDRLTPNKCKQNIEDIQQELLKSWNTLPPQFITSSVTELGKEEILSFINNINRKFYH